MDDASSLPTRRHILVIIGVFLALGLLVYGRSLGDDFVRWDDGMLIYENPAVREITPWSLKRIFTTYDPELYIPLTFITYQIDYKISGTSAFSYHLTSLLLHIANAVLVSWLAFLLIGRWAHGRDGAGGRPALSIAKLIAVLCGLLFLLHPLHTEAVAWASGRKDVLSTFFFLSSLIAYLRWRDLDERKLFLWSVVFFVLGLMSKVMVITLPVILLLLDYQQGRKWSWRMITEKWPYFAAAVIFGIVAIFGKTAVVASSTLPQKILMACKSAFFYLQQIFWPFHFSLLYPYTKAITISSPDFYIPVIVVIIILLVAWLARMRARDVTFAILFYLITVAPTFINFAKGGDLDVYFASDRYAYIPSIGILYLVCFFVFSFAGFFEKTNARTNEQTIAQTLVAFASAIMLIFLAFLSYKQSLVWRDTETLFANVLALYPDSSHVAHNNLGNMHRLRGEIDKSIDEYKKAIAIRPHAKTYSNLGAAYRKQGQLTEAMRAYEEGLKIDDKSAIAHIGMAVIMVDQGRLSEAEAEYKEGLQYDPTEEVGWTNLGVLYTNQGRLVEAVEAYRQALQNNPYFADAHYNLAVALTKQGDDDGAIDAYWEVVHIAPAFIPARINLALLLHKSGDTPRAREQFEVILKIDPGNVTAKQALMRLER